MDFKKIFKRQNLPWIGLGLAVVIIVAVIAYKNKKECQSKKMAREAALVVLTAQAIELEIDINQRIMNDDHQGLDLAKEELGSIREEIEHKQRLLDAIAC